MLRDATGERARHAAVAIPINARGETPLWPPAAISDRCYGGAVAPPPSATPVELARRPSRDELDAGRVVIAAASATLLDDQGLLDEAELWELANVPDELVGALAALAHQVRLDRCGPEVSLEGIV